MRQAILALSIILAVQTTIASEPAQRTLTFEDRVRAQAAIERVYYSRQIGATKPFEQAVPRAILEKKVRTYLSQSVALEKFWKTPVTAEMVRREMERQATSSQLPDMLLALYAGLDKDAFLVQECLARATLVDRLTRGFQSFDQEIQSSPRREAERLHDQLVDRRRPVSLDDSMIHVVQFARANRIVETSDVAEPQTVSRRIPLSDDEFDRTRKEFPERVGEIGAVEEDRDGFLIRVTVSETRDQFDGAHYRVPKVTWDNWWHSVEASLDPADAASVAQANRVLPTLRVNSDRGRSIPQDITIHSTSSSPDTSCPLADTWQSTVEDMPDARYYSTAVWTGTYMLVFGGYTGSSYRNDWRYDPATDTWGRISQLGSPSWRVEHTAVWTGSEMIVWGGGGNDPYLNTGGRYDPVLDTWSTMSTTNAPVGRRGHVAVWAGSRMVIWGGRTPSATDTGGVYDPTSDSWSPTTQVGAPSPRTGFTGVPIGNQMVVWGGNDVATAKTGARYDWVTDAWISTSVLGAPSARQGHSAVSTGAKMIVWGGRDSYGDILNSGAIYDPASDTWKSTTTVGVPTAGSEHTAIWTGSRMIVWGGSNSSGNVATGGRYDPVANAWSPTSTSGAPTARFEHVAVWAGTRMLVWGGYGSNGYLKDGGRYDPQTDSWTPTSIADSPSARSGHTAVWTGNQMIIWGGQSGGAGGRYSPATDSWVPISTQGAPSDEGGHTALWTGSRMIAWGGYYLLNTGGQYDPIADAWTATTTANAPNGRYSHKAVWTGTTMIVWGGYNGGFLNTGGRYDPASDTWVATNGAGAPSQRYGHTAVWTGRVMIVWGGYSYSGFTNTGGRYDPASDTWTPTGIGAAPSPRQDHSAVWTGTRMIVWGGSGSSGPARNTGRLYDPETDSWTETSTSDAPSGRYGHSAIWTNGRMIIWGGRDSSPTNTGAMYYPDQDVWLAMSSVGAPSARIGHTDVWTGNRMIIWGGGTRSGGIYTAWQDQDNDADGYTSCGGDCDDANPNVHPGLPEVCNALDDDCDGTVDNGAVDMCNDQNVCTTDLCNSGTCMFTSVAVPEVDHSVSVSRVIDAAMISWTDAPGPFNVYRGSMTAPSWIYNESCLATGVTSPAMDAELPDPGVLAYYLVSRVGACGESVVGRDSSGAPIPITNPCP